MKKIKLYIKNLFSPKTSKPNYAWLIGLLFLLIFITGLVSIKNYSQPKIKSLQLVTNQFESKKNNLSDFNLSIPKLKLEAPIVANVNGANKEEYFKALENGVAQMKGTAKPGEGSNIVIFGHSSYYKDQPGNYKEVFKNLNQLAINETINIQYQGKDYEYVVAETKVVEPDDISIVNLTKTEQLTLVTCWPPNTSEKRYVVIARLR